MIYPINRLDVSEFGANDYLNAKPQRVRQVKKDKFFFCSPRTIGNILLAGLSLVLWDSRSAQAAPPPGYNLVFDEEFNGPLDVPPWTGWAPGHKWTTHTPYGGDFGQAYFTGPDENATTPDPFSISNGILTIQAYQDPTINNHWRSGLLSSADVNGNGFSQALGYWECRMMLPAGQGIWPAFWLDGVVGINKTRTTNSPEIDVLEAFGVDMTVAHHYVHVWTPAGKDICAASTYSTGVNLSNSWHIYGCLVNTDYIHFCLDGLEVSKIATPIEATLPLYVMVNLALGNGFPIDIPSPTCMYVDYVRAYAK
jgi:beta-glucanase (GH16 family)